MSADPIRELQALFARAREVEPGDATAAALASADGEGRASVRMVLVKQVDERGLVFFTNYQSAKAAHFAVNPWCALCFHWPNLGRQVRVEGPVTRIAAEESDAYFDTRPRDSQLGAWASRQSAPLADRESLERRFEELAKRYEGKEVPRPDFWGGYRITPQRIEIWTGRAHRLHDRLSYARTDADGWQVERLYP